MGSLVPAAPQRRAVVLSELQQRVATPLAAVRKQTGSRSPAAAQCRRMPARAPAEPLSIGGRMEHATIGEELLEERRRQRRAGDPRLTDADRETFRRIATGDLVDEFQAALDSDLADPLLGGHDDTDHDDA